MITKLSVSPAKSEQKLIINGQTISVEVARKPEQLTQGLSGREKLPQNSGMLFIFDKSAIHPFWMKEMKFNLDAVFINGAKVVDFVENIPFPQGNDSPQTFLSKADFDKVLEVNAGTIKRLGIKAGDVVRITDSETSSE